MTRVLVWPSTCEAGREAMRALSWQRGIEVLGAASSDADVTIPDVNTDHDRPPWWLSTLYKLYTDCRFDWLYPVHDECIRVLADCGVQFPCVMHPVKSLRITLSKRATYAAFPDISPQVYTPTDHPWPVYVKPDFGYGGKTGGIAYNGHDFNRLNVKDPVLCEVLEGPEYTVDCFSQNGELKWSQKRSRERVINGMSTVTCRLPKSVATLFASLLNNALKPNGAWYYQVKDGKLLEVGLRIAGGSALARANNVNLPLLSLHAAMGRECTVVDTHAVQVMRQPLAREFDVDQPECVYIDLEDTLVRDGKIHPGLLALIARRHNAGLDWAILTRADRAKTKDLLSRCGLPGGTMHSVHCVEPGQSKADWVKRDDCLVDDSHKERSEVHERTGAMVMDANTASEVL